MASYNMKKKNGSGYCIKIFKQSIKEMGLSEKPNGPQSKSPDSKTEQDRQQKETFVTQEMCSISGASEEKQTFESSVIGNEMKSVSPDRCLNKTSSKPNDHVESSDDSWHSSGKKQHSSTAKPISESSKHTDQVTENNNVSLQHTIPMKEVHDDGKAVIKDLKDCIPPSCPNYNEHQNRRDSNNNVHCFKSDDKEIHGRNSFGKGNRPHFGHNDRSSRRRERKRNRSFRRDKFDFKRKEDFISCTSSSSSMQGTQKDRSGDQGSNSEDWSSELLNVSEWNNDSVIGSSPCPLNRGDGCSDNTKTSDTPCNDSSCTIDKADQIFSHADRPIPMGTNSPLENNIGRKCYEFDKPNLNDTRCRRTDTNEVCFKTIECEVKNETISDQISTGTKGEVKIILDNESKVIIDQDTLGDNQKVDHHSINHEITCEDCLQTNEISQCKNEVEMCTQPLITEINLQESENNCNPVLDNRSTCNDKEWPDNIHEIMNYMPPKHKEDGLYMYIPEELSTISEKSESNCGSVGDKHHSGASLCDAQTKNSDQADSESSHGDIYNKLIKEKMEGISKTVMEDSKREQIGRATNTNMSCHLSETLCSLNIHDISHKAQISKTDSSLLHQQHKISQEDSEKSKQIRANNDSPHWECTSEIKKNQKEAVGQKDRGENWESDLFSAHQQIIGDTQSWEYKSANQGLEESMTLHQSKPNTDSSHINLNGRESKSPIQEKTSTTLNKSYAPVGRGLVSLDQDQNPAHIPKTYIPKGRGVLSPGSLSNLPELSCVEFSKAQIVREKKEFDSFRNLKHSVENCGKPCHGIQPPLGQKMVSKGRGCLSMNFDDNMMAFLTVENKVKPIEPVKWGFNEVTLDTESVHDKLDSALLHHRCDQQELMVANHSDDLIDGIKAKQSQTVVNPYFEECDDQATSECESSMSSQPQCEHLSFKSQSTLSGVPTMSDFEIGENCCNNETKDDVQDDILDDENSELFESDIDLKGSANLQEHPTLQTFKDFEDPEIDDGYAGYYYPDVIPCHCHPSLHQFWVWHSCLCQAPRLCEIRTCSNYWMPFEAMEGIYYTKPIPEATSKRSDKEAAKTTNPHHTKQNAHHAKDPTSPPGLSKLSKSGRNKVMPPYMPPAPPTHQMWERIHAVPPISPYRMSYHGPAPINKPLSINSPPAQNIAASPFVCAQEFYNRVCVNKKNAKHRRNSSSEKENIHNDSGVVMEGLPGFIGPVIPNDAKPVPWDKLVESSADSRSQPRKRLVDYSYSETDESEEEKSRSSQSEKRPRESADLVIVHDSTSDEETSNYPIKNKEVIPDKSMCGKVSTSQNLTGEHEREMVAESDDGSSRYQDCSSTLSNYHILQTVLNKKFPKNQKNEDLRKVEDGGEVVDLTDDGSEILSVASQESSEKDYQLRNLGRGHLSPRWSENIAPPIGGYPQMFSPYSYPHWVNPELFSSMYTQTLNSQHYQYPTSKNDITQKSEERESYITSPEREKIMCHNTPSPAYDKRSHVTVSPAESGFSETPDKNLSKTEDNEASPQLGGSKGRGMTARMRFLSNSKLMNNDATFQARLALLQKNKQIENDSQSDSQSSVSSPWKIRFLENCRKYSYTFIDSHCHIDFLFHRSEFGGTWSKYKEENADTFPHNFEGCVAVFCHPSSFRADGIWTKIAMEEDVWITFGCHPKNATEFTERTENNLKLCLKHPKVVALGEIGLDYSSIFEKHKEVQQIVFRKQIQIALDMNKPLVIHCRDAEDDTLHILDEMVPKNYKIHCHCFTGNYESAKKWMDMFPNLFIGLTPLVTFKSATPTHEVARFIPLERLLLETDAPYFIPRKCPRSEFPFSHPGMAITVAEEVSWLKKCPMEDVLLSCRQNTRIMYGI